MEVWLPYVVRAGEALLFGIATAAVTYSQTSDWNAAIAAFLGALAGKASPSQMTFLKK